MSVNPAVLDQWRRARRPVLSVLLGASWLLLQQSVDPGNLITAVVLGWGLPRLVGGFMGPAARPRAWVRAVRLVITVTRDIVVSNITVAKLVLDPRRQPQPAWVKVPLTLEEPLSRALAGVDGWITGLRREQSNARAEVAEVVQEPGRLKISPLVDWTWGDVWHFIATHALPYNELHDNFFPSIGCEPCTRAISVGEDFRAGRWWWEQESAKECGLHVEPVGETSELKQPA